MKWLLIIFLFFNISEAQFKRTVIPRLEKRTFIQSNKLHNNNYSQAMDIFKTIEQGIKSSSVGTYEKHLAPIISIAIGSEISGSYSTNQAISILTNHFANHHPILFEFSSIHTNTDTPYATGRFNYIAKGDQESGQIYVSLLWYEKRWVINQFNIY
jgi:hypothetical protein